jgi:hypothetical protein
MTADRALLATLWLLVLAGCGGDAPPADTPPPTPEQLAAQKQCQAQAYDDPAVKLLLQRRISGNEHDFVALLPEEKATVADLTRSCMARKGLAPRGGVERVRPPPL